MGCTVREKHIRTNRRPRPLKTDHPAAADGNVSNNSGLNFQVGFNNNNGNPNLDYDDGNWGYCTEEQLEEILLKNLEFLYNEAIVKLVALGYDEDVALKAILRNGHCYGGMDVLTNILHNSLAFLNGGGNGDENEHVFGDLRELEEYSLAGMVCLLQQIKPNMSKGDAMWCLLMSELHVGRASVMEMPNVGNGDGVGSSEGSVVGGGGVVNGLEKVGNDSVGVTPALCRFHGGWGFGNSGMSNFPVNRFISCTTSETSLRREIECPKRFNLSPSMEMLLKQNVAMFAAGYRANPKHQSQVGASSLSNGHSSNTVETSAAKVEEGQSAKNREVVNMMLSKFRDMNLEGDTEYVPEDQKDEMILSLIHQVKDLEQQVKERKEWAHQKAMQAARKLSNDLTELKMLRMEREEIQRQKQVKSTVEDPTMKRLSDMETALRKASSQVDRTNAAVRRLETENAEMRAEMEASKLSASESVNTCLEVARREKKYLKRLLAWEKQRAKLQDDIAAEKRRILELQEEMIQVEAAKSAAEAKWRQEQKARESALAQVDEERRLKEAAEATNKRKHEALWSKIELDFQRHKDDLQRLEQELSRLKMSTNLDNPSTNQSRAGLPNGSHPTIVRLLNELDDFDETEGGIDRECIICLKDEVSVVFLPCAHQVLCANCNDEYGNGTKGKATCPICRVAIEQRIRVFGANS